MVDFSEIFQLVDNSTQLTQELSARFQNGGSANGEQRVVDAMLSHFGKHRPNPQICETDLQGIIVSVNDTWLQACRYEREEVIGQNINLLRSSRSEVGLFTDMWNTIQRGQPWRGELQNRAKDYETYSVEILVVPQLGADGKPVKYWSLAFDISERASKQEALEAKNRELLDSLTYAKRIQKTILPEKAAMDELLGDYFVLFKPKDVVSGDFYWFARNIRTAFLAVVDCTGHGVPGAFMSLIGYNLLNQIVNEKKIIRPGEILSELHKQVRNTLKQDATDSKSRDGMDVCLVAVDIFDDSFEYAGANRPLYFWRHSKNELEEIKADKMSIGGEQLEEERVFKTHQLEVEEGDAIFLFSDGFTDQIGGPEQKKFSSKKLKQLIAENHHETMSVQRAMFNIVWKDWKGDDEQLDDVTLIGKRF